MTVQSFPLVAPGKFAQVFPVFIGGVLPIVIALAMFIASKGSKDWLVAAPTLLILPLVAGGLAWSMHHRRLEIDNGRLVLRRAIFPKFLAMAELDLAHARIVDLDTTPDLQPVMKIAGSGMPGYRVGLFRLRNRSKAWLRLTDWRRVLVLPLRNGDFVLLSPTQPDALLDALRRAAG